MTSFGYEFFRVSEAVQLLGICTVGDLQGLAPTKFLENPSLTPQRAKRLVQIIQEWRKNPLVQQLGNLTQNDPAEHSKPLFPIPIPERSLAREEERTSEVTKLNREVSKIPSQKSRKAISQHCEELFSNIDPKGGEETIHAAVLAIVRRLQALPAPRSLCEVGVHNEDYRWLCTWAWDLTPQIAYKWLAGSWSGVAKGADAGGSLLLLLAAEAARREAREGHVWPAVENKFQPRTRRLLFMRGHPTSLYKEAIEAVAHLWKLRHVFGLEGTQNYYVSIYLQFGFTLKGLEQLPFWLAGFSQTAAIQHLLLAPSLGSATFKQLWSALRDFRQNRITEKHLRQTLESNPWVLPEWTDEIVLRAREKLEIDPTPTGQAGANDDQPLSFLEPPRLQWDPPADPLFISRPINLSALDLSTERYELRMGNRVLATLLRQPDESYLLDRESLLFPCQAAQPTISLVDDAGTSHTNLQLDLWDPTEDVTVYELPSGRRLDAWQNRLNPRRAYVLLTASDLEIQPSPAIWHWVGGERRLSLLSPEWSPQLQILLDGEVFWTPYVSSGTRQSQPEPAWVRGVQLISKSSNSRVTLGEALRLRVVGLRPDVQVDFVRLGTRPLDFHQSGELVDVEVFSVTPEIAASGLNFILGLRQENERVRIRRTLDHIDIIGGVRLTEKGWEPIDPEDD